MTEELLPILDDSHNIIGTAPRSVCHDGQSFLLHPVVHLHILKGDSILLQHRSPAKKVQPGKWDTCVGGHVSAGESVGTALLRESQEEIGIDATPAKFLTSYIFRSAIERELINVHILEVDDDFEISVRNDEVTEVRFWKLDEILRKENSGLFTPNFLHELKTCLIPRHGSK